MRKRKMSNASVAGVRPPGVGRPPLRFREREQTKVDGGSYHSTDDLPFSGMLAPLSLLMPPGG